MAFELLEGNEPTDEPVDWEDHGSQIVEVFGLSEPVPFTHKLAKGDTVAFMEVIEATSADRAARPAGIFANGLRGRCRNWRAAEQECIVETFEGLVLSVPGSNLKTFTPPDPEDGGFDVAWPGGDWEYNEFTMAVGGALLRKGHCVVQLFGIGESFQAEAMRVAKSRSDFRVLETELQSAYLGEGTAGGKIAQLAAAPMGCLELCDQMFGMLGQLLEPVSATMLGFDCCGRSSTLMRIPRGDEMSNCVTDSDVNEGVVEGLLHFLKRRKVCMLCPIADAGGELSFLPRQGLGWTASKLPMSPNKLVLFRHDLMTFTYEPKGDSLVVQSWLYSQPLSLVYDHVEGGDAEERRELIGASGPKQPTGECPHVRAIAVRLSGEADDPEQEWCMVCSGTDGLTWWPRTRWDQEFYYDADEQSAMMQGKSYNNHGAFLRDELLVCFDPEFFQYTEEGKAESTGPEQRIMLEVGYECLVGAGRSRPELRGSNLGIITATYATNWIEVSPLRNENLWHGWTSMQTAACVAQFVGSKGPVMRVDTACSSSLVATATGDHDLRMRRHGTANLICAVMGQLDPFGWGGLCQMGMLSKKGRCFTFDNASDGFAKGEGCGSVYLEFEGKKEDRVATLAGSAINQDGRSASMTAPNGPSQREMTRSCLDVAKITPADLSVSECHGTGTALGDPIEVGALRAAMDGFRGETNPILITTVKCNLAHMEANAGISGVIKVTSMLRHQAVPMCVHVKSLNPHLDMDGFPWYIITEFVDPARTDMYIGVQGFGMGGTNARCDFWGRTSEGYRNPYQRAPKQERADFEEVPCPRCLGMMCWLCYVAVPKYAREHKHHHCSLVRDGPGIYDKDYDWCSICYTGEYLTGDFEEEIPALYDLKNRNVRIYAVGTWSAYTTFHELEEVTPGVFTFAVELGETRAEHFHYVLNREHTMAYYPVVRNAPAHIRVVGPDDEIEGRHWLIDGIDSNYPSGTVLVVTLTWNSDTGYKKVSWDVADDPDEFPERIRATDHANSYHILGSWTAFRPTKMQLLSEADGLFESSFRIGVAGREEFQFQRDADELQTLHPPVARCTQTSTVAKGPDCFGKGRHWVVSGQVGEEVRVQLRIEDGAFSVLTKSSSGSTQQWQSKAASAERHEYFITGSFTDWQMAKMTPDGRKRGLHHYLATWNYDEAHHFHILVDGYEQEILYPASTNASSGDGLLMGPGQAGEDKFWLMTGWPGVTHRITLDMNQEDKRKMVTWLEWNDYDDLVQPLGE